MPVVQALAMLIAACSDTHLLADVDTILVTPRTGPGVRQGKRPSRSSTTRCRRPPFADVPAAPFARLWRTRIGVALVGVIVLLALMRAPYVPLRPEHPVGEATKNFDPSGKAVLGRTNSAGRVSRVLRRLPRILRDGRSSPPRWAHRRPGHRPGEAVLNRNALEDILMRGMDRDMAAPVRSCGAGRRGIVGPHAWVLVVPIATHHRTAG